MVVARNDRQLDGKLDRGLKITRAVKRYDPITMEEIDAPEEYIVFQSDLDEQQARLDERQAQLDAEQARLTARKAKLTALYQSAS